MTVATDSGRAGLMASVVTVAVLMLTACGGVKDEQVGSDTRGVDRRSNLPSPTRTLRNLDDLGRFMTFYYLFPAPHLVPEALDLLAETRPSPGFLPALAGFFSQLLPAHPEWQPRWKAALAAQPPEYRDWLDSWTTAVADRGRLLNLDAPVPALNDLFWGAFFATGDAVFVQRLVQQLVYFDERTDEGLFLTGASAAWSLASNAEQHARVRMILASGSWTGRTAELVSYVLRTPAAEVTRDSRVIYEKIRAGGTSQ